MMKRIYVQRPTGEYKRVAVLQDGARRATPDQLREIQTRLQAKHGNARVVFVNSASWAHADTILRKNLPGAVILKDEGHRRRAPNPAAAQTEAAVALQLRAKLDDLLRAARNIPAARGHANRADEIAGARKLWDALDSLHNDPAILRASSSNAAIARALGLAEATLTRTRQFVADQILGRKRNPHRLALRPGDRVKLVGHSKPVGRVVSKKHPDPAFVFVEWEGNYGPTPEPKRRYQLERASNPRKSNPPGARIVHNRLLGGWYVVTGPHQTPISGRFDSKAEAKEWLNRKRNPTGPPPGTARVRLRAPAVAGRGDIREIGTTGTVMAGSILGGALRVKFDGDRASYWVPSSSVDFLNPGKRDPARLAFVQLLYAAGADALAKDVADGKSITKALRIAKRTWKHDPHRAGLIERAEYLAAKLKVNPAPQSRRRRSQPDGHVPAARRRGAGGRFAPGRRAP